MGANSEDSNQTTTTVAGSADDTGNANGAVYIFSRSGTTWTQTAYVKADNSGNGDQFGYSVALTTKFLAVGSWQEDSNQNYITTEGSSDNSVSASGAAYIFNTP